MKCKWCKNEGDQRLIIGASDGELIEVFFCKKHLAAFVDDQAKKGHILRPPQYLGRTILDDAVTKESEDKHG